MRARSRQDHNVSKGAVGHYIAIARFVEFGLGVFLGYTDVAGVDLVIDTSGVVRGGGALLGVQVKATSSVRKGFRIPRSRGTTASYYALVETRMVDGDERLWVIPAAHVHSEAATSRTKHAIHDLIWKPGEQALRRFADLRGVRELKGARRPRFHASRVGKVGEALAAAWLISRGFGVYPATADQESIDLVVERGRDIRFVQVKFASTGRTFRNVRVPKAVRDSFVLLLVRGNPRAYYLLSGDDALKHRSRSGGLYLNAVLRERFRDNLAVLSVG